MIRMEAAHAPDMLAGMSLRIPRRHLRAVGALVICVSLTAGLAGCVSSAPADTAPSAGPSAPAPQPDEVPVAEPELVPGGDAQQNLPFFTSVLEEFAAGAEPVEGVPVVNALATAGFDRATMQVSFDLSKTGLVADSILVSVRYGSECLIGQIVTADRSVATTREPALTESRTVCLIGNTRAIDW